MACSQNTCKCIKSLIDDVVALQNQADAIDNLDESCNRPFLGPCNGIVFNTRPLRLFACGNNPFEFDFVTEDGTTGTSDIVRVESTDGCCATCMVLAPNPDTTSPYPYVKTCSFCTVSLSCVCSVSPQCDTYVACI